MRLALAALLVASAILHPSLGSADPTTLDQVATIGDLNTPNWWTTFPPGGVMAAAWCFDETGRNNNRIKDKSFRPPSVCPTTVLRYPISAALRERDLGKYAIAAVCYGGNINISGIPVGLLSAADALAACQCHNPTAIGWLARDWRAVEEALKKWGGC